MTDTASRVLIVGGGYVGLGAARELRRAAQRRRQSGRAPIEITLVNPENYMLFRPLLPEVASGTAEARHAVVPLREALPGVDAVSGTLGEIDPAEKTARIDTLDGGRIERSYDHAVMGVGALTRMLPIPGLVEHGIGFSTVAEALFLRNHVLSRLEVAHATPDPARRRRALTFVFVGGGYSGVEAIGELQDLAHDASRWYANIAPGDLHWNLIDAADRLLPNLPDRLEQHASDLLTRRGVDIRLETRLDSAADGAVTLDDGTELATDTLVWAAGMAPNPVMWELGLPVDGKGRLPVDACLRVRHVDGLWAAGDGAAVPDLVAGGDCPPTAQYALRQGPVVARNILAAIDGGPAEEFRYRNKGMFVTLGNRKGVASLGRFRVSGTLAWGLRRAYYSATIPTANRKLRTLADWVVSVPGRHDSSDLGSERHPKKPIEAALRTMHGSG